MKPTPTRNEPETPDGEGICKENVIFHVYDVEITSDEKLKELAFLVSEKGHGSTMKREQRGYTFITSMARVRAMEKVWLTN
tara:strand:- start:188 stop:430 length:243 start_codon:yes stop_codon:yes gene_type:complete